MAAVQAYQADLTQENVIEGVERARERRGGTLPPRGPSFTGRQRREAEEMLRNTTMPAARIAEMLGVGRATLYRHVDVEKIREAAR
jgi:DNA invertase Pin-like site-specific DNA recombinase